LESSVRVHHALEKQKRLQDVSFFILPKDATRRPSLLQRFPIASKFEITHIFKIILTI
jgi:hypothetical protein